MSVLVIGGTKFLGRYVIESALARGHEVPMFNRGARDTLAWDRTRPQDAPPKAGLNAEREAELLRLGPRARTH